MKFIIWPLSALLCASTATSQDAESYYNQAMEKARAGKIEEALPLLDSSIKLNDGEYVAWYNRGLIKTMLNMPEKAVADFDRVISLQPAYKKGYVSRGTAKKRMTDYEGAIADYSYTLSLDANYADAYYNRGLVYEMLGKNDSACADFEAAKKNGIAEAQRKIDKCREKEKPANNYFSILRLTQTAADNKYGFTPEQPVKVGQGPNGGAANQRFYLDLLRDANGLPVRYTRKGSCCAYKTPNGMIDNMGMLDKYEITYTNESGAEVKAMVYISFYDYDELKILHGFKTVQAVK